VIVKVAPPPLQAEIFERFFQGRLKELALHPSANFVLQAMLGAAHSPEQVRVSIKFQW
jgi:nucleolar protein 9